MFTCDNSGETVSRPDVADFAYAVHYVYERGARIINMSYSSNWVGNYSEAKYQIIDAFKDVLFVTSAGNGDTNIAGTATSAVNIDAYARFPASYSHDHIFSVTASDAHDNKPVFANIGAMNVDVAAPGVNILVPGSSGGHLSQDGTSFSAPLVAGLAALMRSYDPELSVAEIKEAIMETAEDPFNNFVGKIAGNGRINAHAALIYAETRLGSGQPSKCPAVQWSTPDLGCNGGLDRSGQIVAALQNPFDRNRISAELVSTGPYSTVSNSVVNATGSPVLTTSHTFDYTSPHEVQVELTISNPACEVEPKTVYFLQCTGSGSVGGCSGNWCTSCAAAQGTFLENYLRPARKLRDGLQQFSAGRHFVDFYYRDLSPFMVPLIETHAVVMWVVRILLAPILLVVAFPFTAIIVIAFAGGLTAIAVTRRT